MAHFVLESYIWRSHVAFFFFLISLCPFGGLSFPFPVPVPVPIPFNFIAAASGQGVIQTQINPFFLKKKNDCRGGKKSSVMQRGYEYGDAAAVF